MAKKPQVSEFGADEGEEDLVGDPAAHTSDGKARPNDHDNGESGLSSYRVAGEELRQFVERIERIRAEKKDLADTEREIFAEAKGRGYDTKVLRAVLTLRTKDANDLAEFESVLEMYCAALGM